MDGIVGNIATAEADELIISEDNTTESTPCCPIYLVSDDCLLLILQYLRAVELATLFEVNKHLFDRRLVSKAISYQLSYIYPTSSIILSSSAASSAASMIVSSSPSQQSSLSRSNSSSNMTNVHNSTYVHTHNAQANNSPIFYTPAHLYIKEVKCILSALNSTQPYERGYWISTAWLANAKKYYEAINLPTISVSDSNRTPVSSAKKSAKRTQKIRSRRGSDSLPPWPSMTTEIVCSHGNLSLSKGSCGKKRLIDSKSWFFLLKFYPLGPHFKHSKCIECEICTSGYNDAKISEAMAKDAEINHRRQTLCLNGPLAAVEARKSGIPAHLLTAKMAASMLQATTSSSSSSSSSLLYESDSPMIDDASLMFEQEEAIALFNQMSLRQPLLPGLYNVVPRSWMKGWRQYCKDVSIKTLVPLDCTRLLCHDHGHLSIPPHLEEYLIGARKSLLSGLGLYTGEVIEILSADEYDKLTSTFYHASDFSIRFCLDGDNIHWSMPVCMRCNPFDDRPSIYHSPGRKSTKV